MPIALRISSVNVPGNFASSNNVAKLCFSNSFFLFSRLIAQVLSIAIILVSLKIFPLSTDHYFTAFVNFAGMF